MAEASLPQLLPGSSGLPEPERCWSSSDTDQSEPWKTLSRVFPCESKAAHLRELGKTQKQKR